MSETYTVKILKLSDGERVVLIINKKTAIPHPDSSQLLLLRKNVLATNTLRKQAMVIAILLNWLRFSSDISALDFLDGMQTDDLFGLWGHLKESKSGKSVSESTHMYRWRVVQTYIKYLSDKALSGMSVKDPLFHPLAKKRDILFAQMSNLNFKVTSKRKSGLEKKDVNEIVEVTRRGDARNPWIKRDQLRNQLIVDILLGLGIRASELLKISMHDISLGTSSPNLSIRKVVNDPADTRVNEPRVKTLGRIIDLSPELSGLFSEYLKERRNIPGAKRTKYVFVSNTTGQAISYARLHGIIKDVALVIGEDIDLSPHSFRRTWNDRFRESAENMGLSQEMITQSQNYLQGRVLNSPEAYKYASKHIEKAAREAHMKYQESLHKKG